MLRVRPRSRAGCSQHHLCDAESRRWRLLGNSFTKKIERARPPVAFEDPRTINLSYRSKARRCQSTDAPCNPAHMPELPFATRRAGLREFRSVHAELSFGSFPSGLSAVLHRKTQCGVEPCSWL